jgi:ApbE superfamily uncharacterized protein (UPF0280 family)
MVEPRFYRKGMGEGRFVSFETALRETDLWIGVDRESFQEEMADFVRKDLGRLRTLLDGWAKRDSHFLNALSPYEVLGDTPPLVHCMMDHGRKAGVGPMASVAGALAQEIGRSLDRSFNVEEIVVENGGDIWGKIKTPLPFSVFAGSSPLSQKVGLTVDPGHSPFGMATSSGKVGHSFSFGKADAVVVVCRDAGLADAYATAFCNQVKTEGDIEPVLGRIGEIDEIWGTLIVMNGRIGVRGAFPIYIPES